MDAYKLEQLEEDMPRMNDDQVVAFIRKKRDEENLSFQSITDLLKKMGHTSKRTDNPLTLNAIRHKYYYGNVTSPRPQLGPNTASGKVYQLEEGRNDAEIKLNQLRKFLELEVTDAIKVKLFEEILKEVDSL
jgi:hypothetical protein